jgi:hypothetical protein
MVEYLIWILIIGGFSLWTYVMYKLGYLVCEVEWLKFHNKKRDDEISYLKSEILKVGERHGRK